MIVPCATPAVMAWAVLVTIPALLLIFAHSFILIYVSLLIVIHAALIVSTCGTFLLGVIQASAV